MVQKELYITDIGGGSSGGGSINIFYKNNISCTGSLEAKGGDIGTNSSGSKSGFKWWRWNNINR